MSDGRELTRRAFLLASASALPLLAAASSACAREGEGKGKCVETVSSHYGPFYREGAPVRERLCGADEPGERLYVAGRVTSAADCAPLAGAVVDVWHASEAGFYDSNDTTRPFDPARFNLRGRVRADAAGRYRFESVVPGNYGGRARHVHLLITAPGHAPLVTEIYFDGEPRNETDRLVRPTLVTRFEALKEGGRPARRGSFDIVLARSA